MKAKEKQKAALVLQNSKHVARVREARARVEAEATRKAEAQAAAEKAKLKQRVAAAKAVEREVDATALCATESDVESNSITLLRPDGMHEQHAGMLHTTRDGTRYT